MVDDANTIIWMSWEVTFQKIIKNLSACNEYEMNVIDGNINTNQQN